LRLEFKEFISPAPDCGVESAIPPGRSTKYQTFMMGGGVTRLFAKKTAGSPSWRRPS